MCSVADRALLPATDSGNAVNPQDIPSIADGSETTEEPLNVSSTDSCSKYSTPETIDQVKTSLASSLCVQEDGSVDSQSVARGKDSCSVDRDELQMVEDTPVSTMTTALGEEDDGPCLFANEGDGEDEEDKKFLFPTFVEMSSVLERRESGRGEEVGREDGEGVERMREEKAHYKPFGEETGGRTEGETTFPYPPPLPVRCYHIMVLTLYW